MMAAGFWRICAAIGAGGYAFAVSAAVAFAFVIGLLLSPVAEAQLFSDNEARIRLDDHQAQLRQFAAHIVEIRKQNSAINEKLSATNQQLGRISQRLQQAEAGIRELRGAQEEQSETIRREREDEGDAIKTRMTATEEQLAELRELLDGIRAEAAGISRDIGELYAFVELPPEQDLYDSAFAEFQGRRYQSALDGFRRVQKFYPNGKFQVNVGYWISNALLALGDYDAVVVAAQDLISRHPQSDKTPDAMLVMARALLQLGRETEAREVLRRLIDEHSTSLAADKARQQL